MINHVSTKEMKICIDARLYKETGVGRYIRSLLDNLPKIDKKNQYSLIVLEKDQEEINKIAPSFTIYPTSSRWHTTREQIAIPILLHKIKPDLVHFPYFNVPIFYNKPFIVTIHDLTILKMATGRATTHSKLYYYLKRLGFEKALSHAVYQSKKIITVSHTIKDEIIEQYKINPGKIAVTYEAGDLEEEKGKHQSDEIGKYLLYVGNAHPHKNLERLITAFQSVRHQYPKIKLLLIGNDDFFYQRMQKEISSDNKENIIFLGPVSNNELVVYYQNALAFIFPSLSEGFGIPGLEAMKLGCPLICSNIKVFQEIYQDACLMFDPKNPQDLAEKVSQIISDSDLRLKLIQKGHILSSFFSWQKMSEETLNIYNLCQV